MVCEMVAASPDRHVSRKRQEVINARSAEGLSGNSASKVCPGAFSKFHAMALRRGISEEVVEGSVVSDAEMFVSEDGW